MGWPTVVAVFAIFSVLLPGGRTEMLYGCSLSADLCNVEETCVDDGLFGQCRSALLADQQPLMSVGTLDPIELQLLRLELARLVKMGVNWTDARTQCVIAYFKLSIAYKLRYDTEFCAVRKPENVWALLQLVQQDLSSTMEDLSSRSDLTVSDEALPPIAVDAEYVQNVQSPPIYVDVDETAPAAADVLYPYDTAADQDVVGSDEERQMLDGVVRELLSSMPDQQELDESVDDDQQQQPQQELMIADKRSLDEDQVAPADPFPLTEDEQALLNEFIAQIMEGQEPDFSGLSDEQLDKFISYIQIMQQLVNDRIGYTMGEMEEPMAIGPDTDPDGEQMLLKKDTERLGDVDQGLDQTEHKIVKGHGQAPANQLHRVIGNRVYIRMDRPLDQAQLLQLMAFLEESIGRPKNLTFDDFAVSDSEVSFRVSHVDDRTAELENLDYLDFDSLLNWRAQEQQKRLVPASSVAEAVYKRRKDIQTIAGGAHVDETGVGSGSDNLPVDGKDRDTIVVPTLIACGLIVGVLVTLFGVYAVRNKTEARNTLHRIAQDLEGRPSKAYEELCRQRMAAKGDGAGEALAGGVTTLAHRLGSQSDASPPTIVPGSKTSSTSSWSEEPIQQTNMDISTGHMILSYLEDHLERKDRLDTEWAALESYQSDRAETTIAEEEQNRMKNRFPDVLPYDHTLVRLQSGIDADITQCGDYINASAIYDSDPRSPVYIVAQAPMLATAAEFWQMIWEQGSVVIVNLTKLAENGDAKCHRYWPENGSEVHGVFEVHLVSEHIWCEDYLVRSFYLKNLRTNETRTVTQFHFLSWPDDSVPTNTKPLLEFRRKVNKSYRGRSCPIVVHCSDGAGRSGTYCLLDMVLNRINKGVKEMDIAATLEHLRDQRMNMVRTKQQYSMVLTCVAEEVQAILKALPQP
uniref:Receptor-type tyrosine-protein phosphatase N2 n=1 Tax=Plectus sambesii TaxID=2011161 RepID=A0A914W4E5_9BILA